MRSAKDTDAFPYRSSLICYFEVYRDGTVKRVHHKNKCDFPNVVEAYERLRKKTTTLYAVWPGQYSSDLFIIDDLNVFREAFGIENKELVGV